MPPDGKPGTMVIFGEFGTGKTTLLRTMLSCIKGELVLTGFDTGSVNAANNHASTTLRLVEICPGLRILDSWGSEPNCYKDNAPEFRRLLRGELPLGIDIKKGSDPNELDKVPKESGAPKPDVVFFTITQQLVQNQDYIKRLAKFMEIMGEERPGALLGPW